MIYRTEEWKTIIFSPCKKGSSFFLRIQITKLYQIIYSLTGTDADADKIKDMCFLINDLMEEMCNVLAGIST